MEKKPETTLDEAMRMIPKGWNHFELTQGHFHGKEYWFCRVIEGYPVACGNRLIKKKAPTAVKAVLNVIAAIKRGDHGVRC